MTAKTLVWKTLHNATRCFEKHLGVWQAKAMKRLTFWIIQKGTTVLQALYSKEDQVQVNKYRECLSNHLGKVELEPIIQEKAKVLINKSKRYKGRNILAGDASDIFKPHAQCMEALKVVRDGSTWNIWNGYVIYGININGITQQLEIKDPNTKYIGSEKRQMMLQKSALLINPKETIGVFDRGHDDVWFIDMLIEEWFRFVVRAKKSRIVIDLKDGKRKKVETLKIGKYKVQLEIGTQCYLYVVKWTGKQPIRLYSDIDFGQEKEALGIYLRRRKIEEDYKKLKSFGLEKVRLMSLKKVINIMLIIQFIIMLGQSLYNEVSMRVWTIEGTLWMHYKNFCKKRNLTQNPSSFLRFVSANIESLTFRYWAWIPKETLFWDRYSMKKVGLI